MAIMEATNVNGKAPAQRVETAESRAEMLAEASKRADAVLAEIRALLEARNCRIVVQKTQGSTIIQNGALAEGVFYAWAVEAFVPD